MTEEEAKKLLSERDSEFNSVKEIGEDIQLKSASIPPPKPKIKEVAPAEEYSKVEEMITEPIIKSVHSNFDIGWYEIPLESLPTQGFFYLTYPMFQE